MQSSAYVPLCWQGSRSWIKDESELLNLVLTELLCYSKRDSVLWPELLQFRYDAVCHIRRHFCHQAVFHSFFYVQSVFQREIDEVCIDDNVVRGTKLLVILEEKRRTGFWQLALDDFSVFQASF
jgi:hypothetical protein